MNSYEVVGKSIVRNDGADKILGRAQYSVDLIAPNYLWCVFVRSPYAHATIKSIDYADALALDGVEAVLTGQDVEGLRGGNIIVDEPLLSSWDRVRFIGDKIAAVAAVDRDTAVRASNMITVEYDQLPAVFDPVEASLDSATLIHPDYSEYRNSIPQETPSNVYHHVVDEKGDIKNGFELADVIIEGSYSTERVHQAYLEPHSSLVYIDDESRLQIWCSNQAPTARRVHLARMVGLERSDVVINPINIGGSYGGKLDVTGVAVSYFLSKITGKPIKFVMDYQEEFSAMNPRHPSIFKIKAGVKRDGTITAWEVSSYFASGGYAAYAPSPPFGEMSGRSALDVYDIPNVKIESRQVYTNTVPCGYFRAPGSTQAVFAGESHIDVIARSIDMDPIDFRRKNMIFGNRSIGKLDDANLDTQPILLNEVIDMALKESGYYGPKNTGIGRGIAITEHGQIGFEGHASVHIYPDGRVLANMSTFDPGMGTATILAQVLSEELGLPVERIEVKPWNTGDGFRDQGVGGSRGARVTSIAGYEAAQNAKTKLKRLAAEFYGWDEDSIEIEGGDVIGGDQKRKVPFFELANMAGEPITGEGHIDEGRGNQFVSYAAHVAEVLVDKETGQVTLKKYCSVQETGKVLNPIGFEGQIEGGILQGIGQALMEDINIDQGRVSNPSFSEYKIPVVTDIPEFKSFILESEQGHGPYNVRGIGEGAITMPCPAIMNAIQDACGVRVGDLPATSEKIYKKLRSEILSGLS